VKAGTAKVGMNQPGPSAEQGWLALYRATILGRLVGEIRQVGGQAAGAVVDATDPVAVEAYVAQVEEAQVEQRLGLRLHVSGLNGAGRWRG
jgi:hypothetical protein